MALGACSDRPSLAAPDHITLSPPTLSQTALPAQASPNTAGLLVCSVAAPATGSAVIGPNGGSLVVAGHAMVVPKGAVPTPTRFTMDVPASPYIEVTIHPDNEEHYSFKRPVVITLSYSRCTDAELPAKPLRAWWIDPRTKNSLGVMAGFDDRHDKRVVLFTDHLSGYAVAHLIGDDFSEAGF